MTRTCDYCDGKSETPCRSMGQAACCAHLQETIDRKEREKIAEAIMDIDATKLPVFRLEDYVSPLGNVNVVPQRYEPMYRPEDILPKHDAVHQPKHYARWTMQPIEFIASNDLPWWLHNVIKYTMRFDAKDGLQDLYKARSYLDMKIRQLEGHSRFWEKPVATERALNNADQRTCT